MTDDEFLSYLFDRFHDPAYVEKDEAYIQSRADDLIAAGEWGANDRQGLVEVLREATDPKASFRGLVVEEFRNEALRCLGPLATPVQNVPVGFLPTTELNAFASKNPSGGYVVVLNSGLEAGLQLLFYSYLAIATYPFEHAFDRTHDVLDFVQSIVTVAHSVATDTPNGVVNMPTWDCHEKVLQDETMLTFALIVDVFVMLHEYGHILCGHLDAAATHRIRLGSSEEEILLPSHAQEYEADAFALRHISNFAPDVSFAQIVYPVGVFFRFLDLCEAISGREESATHPPSLTRWQRLKDQLDQRTSDDPDVRNVDTVFDNIFVVLETLLAPT